MYGLEFLFRAFLFHTKKMKMKRHSTIGFNAVEKIVVFGGGGYFIIRALVSVIFNV